MPNRPRRVCLIATCPHPALSRGRCAAHAQRDEIQRHPFAHVYRDSRWSGRGGLRQQVLTANPLCEICMGLAQCVDHIIPHRGNERLAYDINNLRPLCNRCHGQVTAAQTWRRR